MKRNHCICYVIKVVKEIKMNYTAQEMKNCYAIILKTCQGEAHDEIFCVN